MNCDLLEKKKAWEQRKVGEFLKESKISGSNGAEAKKLTVKLWGKGIVPKSEVYEGSAATQYYIRKAGQFMYGKLDFLNQAFGIVPEKLDGYESTVDSPAFDFSERLNSYFFLKYVSRKSFYQYQGMIANGSRKAKRIHADTFFDMPLVLPKKNEQDKIAEFITTLDHTIALHQRKLELLQQTKKGFLQKIFPQQGERQPQPRFKEFSEPWEQLQFTSIAERVSKQSNADNIPKIEFEDIISGQGELNKDVSKKFDSRKGILFETNDVLFGKLRPYLKNWLFPDFPGIALGDFWVLRSKKGSPSFLYYLIQANNFQNVANRSSGTKMPRSDWKTVSTTEFKIPKNEAERMAIGEFFSKVDSLIALHKKKTKHLKKLKKAYMQKMFI